MVPQVTMSSSVIILHQEASGVDAFDKAIQEALASGGRMFFMIVTEKKEIHINLRFISMQQRYCNQKHSLMGFRDFICS